MDKTKGVFVVADSAIAEIQRRFRLFHARDPIARIYEKSEATHLFEDFKKKDFFQSRTEQEIRDITKERLSNAGALQSSIEVGVGEREEFRVEELTEIGGITFAMGKEFQRMLNGCSLVFEGDRFWLFDSEGKSQTLVSLARRLASRSMDDPAAP